MQLIYKTFFLDSERSNLFYNDINFFYEQLFDQKESSKNLGNCM